MATPFRTITLAETEKDAHVEEAVSKVVAPKNKKSRRDAGCLAALEDFSARPLSESLELKVGYNRETLATTEEITPVQEP